MNTIGLIQLDIACDNKSENYRRAEELLKQAAGAACDLAILPEVFDTGFSQNIASTARDSGDTRAFLSAMATKYHLAIVAGIAEPAANPQLCRNVAVAVDCGGQMLAKYSKIHPFSFTKEDHYFVPGNRLVTCNILGVPTALFVCYDLRFPEIFRCVARKVQMMIVVANWPASRQPHWEALLRARAIENQCVVIGVNRTGTDLKGIQYPGGSRIYDAYGEEIPSRALNQELLMADVDIAEVTNIRQRFPFLQDMRPLSLTL